MKQATFTLGHHTVTAPNDLWALAGFSVSHYTTESGEVRCVASPMNHCYAHAQEALAAALARGLRDADAVLDCVAGRSITEQDRRATERARLEAEAAQATLRAAQIQSAIQKRSLKDRG